MDDILTVAEAAEILGRTVPATRRLLMRGSVRGRKVGRPPVWVTTRQELQEYAGWARSHAHWARRRRTGGQFIGDL